MAVAITLVAAADDTTNKRSIANKGVIVPEGKQRLAHDGHRSSSFRFHVAQKVPIFCSSHFITKAGPRIGQRRVTPIIPPLCCAASSHGARWLLLVQTR
jgi:hypothetical protein